MIRKIKYFILFFFIYYIYSFFNLFSFTLSVQLETDLRTKLKFSQDQIKQINNIISVVSANNLPEEPVIGYINESIVKRVEFSRFYTNLEKLITSLSDANRLINGLITEKFSPSNRKDAQKILSQLLLDNLKEDECLRFMALFSSQNISFDDSLSILSYYTVFKNFLISKDGQTNNNAELIFLKYYTRPIKELSSIIQAVVNNSKNLDTQKLYDVLNSYSKFPTNKLLKKIQQLAKENLNKELEQEIIKDKNYESKQQRF